MMKDLFRILRVVSLFLGLMFIFFAIIELIRAFQTLYAVHKWMGWTFLGLIILALIALIYYVWINIHSLPRALTPPKRSDDPSLKQQKKYLIYLNKYIDRLKENEILENEKKKIEVQQENLVAPLIKNIKNSKRSLVNEIEKIEIEIIKPNLSILQTVANEKVHASVRDVMIGVALSPYKSLDLLIVVYRNILMCVHVMRLYNARASIVDQFRILVDIINVIATINYINMSSTLVKELAASIPGLRASVEIVAQGIGAGFMTSIAGHATIRRCSAFQDWNVKEEKANIGANFINLFNDVKNAFFKDVWDSIRDARNIAPSNIDQEVDKALKEKPGIFTKWFNGSNQKSDNAQKLSGNIFKALVSKVTKIIRTNRPKDRPLKAPSNQPPKTKSKFSLSNPLKSLFNRKN